MDMTTDKRMGAERRRLTLALLVSLLLHALLLSLTFGGQALGFPGLDFPWRERRIEAPDLHVVLMPAQVSRAAEPAGASVKEPLLPASIEQAVAGGSARTPHVSPAPTLGRTVEAIVPEAEPIPEPGVIAMERSDAATSIVPAVPTVPTPVIAAAPSASSPQALTLAPRDAGDATLERVDPQALERAVELAKLDRADQEARRQAVQLEAERIESERQESARQEAERQAAAKQEAARREAEAVETARQETARQVAQRVENERHEAASQEAARQESVRQESARQEAARQEAAHQEVLRQEALRVETARAETARREATLRAIGRQLDEEAAKREAASTAPGLPSRLAPSTSSARRGRLFGRTDPNAELVLYAEAWARKIQLNMTFDMVRDAAKRPHTDPLVTVAIRSDGSVESVIFVLSSGVAEIDAAIRRIVQSQLPYQAFPPGLASEFDVIEVRRTWHFDMAIRLY
jgi:hypothetical protein